MKKVIHITHEMPDETLDDLLCTATGGIHYWAVRIDGNQWSEFEESNDPGDFALKHIGAKFTLDADLIAKGIEACSKARPDIWHRFATDVIDGSADIDACDTIVQFGVFGELVYG